MAVIEKFLGQRVNIPDDRRYAVKQGVWAKLEDNAIVCGLSEPALVLSAGIKGVDWLVADGVAIQAGDSVIFAITGKISYLDAPVSGSISFNGRVKENPSLIGRDPYGQGWLFKIEPESETDAAMGNLADAGGYLKVLRGSEGLKNPEGIKGGVSGMCKAVYSGIGEQKI